MLVYRTFNLYCTSAIEVGFVRWNFSNDTPAQLVDFGEYADADQVLLTRLLCLPLPKGAL